MATPIGQPIRSSQCYGRTDVPTKNPITHVDPIKTVNADARTSIHTLGEVIDEANGGRGLWISDDRHPVIRTGTRDPIPAHVRAAVWFRDRGKCEWCSAPVPSDQPWHLDHITPWSAGGPDTTDNLRVLCEHHNMDRGNRIDPTERSKQPATWWCINCYDLDRHSYEYLPAGWLNCPIHPPAHVSGKSWCRIQRGYWRHFNETGETPTWHQRPMLTTFDQIAYCAHCDAPGATGRVL